MNKEAYQRLKLRTGKAVARAWRDEAFRNRLIEEPEATLRSMGIEVPPGMEIKVLEDSDESQHTVTRLDT